MKILKVLIIFIFITELVNAQNYNSQFFNYNDVDSTKKNKLYFRLENSNLLKNNEYFNNFIDGYTLLGYFIKPKLVYYPTKKSRIDAGAYLLKYSGVDSYTTVSPIFTFRYNFNSRINLLLGTINGPLEHNLIEPIFKFERYFENNNESGIQFLFKYPNLETDLWVNWEQFILKDDPFQEHISFGITNEYNILKKLPEYNISLIFQFLAKHKGGQFDKSTLPMQTLLNTVSGFSFSKKLNNTYFTEIGTKNYFLTFADLSPKPQYIYSQGWGLYYTLFFSSKNIYIEPNFWYGKFFISAMGDPNYMCISDKYRTYYEPNRNIISTKLEYKIKLFTDINLGVRAEPYYDIFNQNFDYSFGIHITFNRDFFLTELK